MTKGKATANGDSGTLVGEGAPLYALLSGWYGLAIENRRQLGIDADVLSAINADRMIASPAEEQMFARFGVTKETYDPTTHTRCTAARSLILDVLGGTINRPWGLDPSPDPEIPGDAESEIVAEQFNDFFAMVKAGAVQFSPETAAKFIASRYDDIVERKVAWARTHTKRMERVADDILVEGGFNDALTNAVDDACVRGTAIIGWTKQRVPCVKNSTGRWVRGLKMGRVYRRVDMLDVYPMSGVTDFDNGGVFVRVRWPIHSFEAMAGEASSGWRPDAVKAVLAQIRPMDSGDQPQDQGALTEDQAKRAEKTDATGAGRRVVSGVEAWVDVPESALTGRESSKSVRIMAVFAEGQLVRFRRLSSWETPPYAKAHFYHTPASFFGVGIPRVLMSPQAALNVIAAMLKKNVQFSSSASMVFNDYASLIGGERPGAASMDVYKVFAFRKPTSGAVSGKNIDLLQIESRVPDLERAYSLYQQIADEASGVPRYVYGQSSSATGAGRTLGGLRMLRDSALRGITAALANIDTGIVKPIVQGLVDDLNTSEDVSEQVKCDAYVVSAGVLGMVQRSVETQERMQTLVAFSGNQMLGQVVGSKVLQSMAREVLKDQHIDGIEEDMPSREMLETRELLETLAKVTEQRQAAEKQNADAQAGQQGDAVPPQPGDVGEMQQTGQAPAAGSVEERRGAA